MSATRGMTSSSNTANDAAVIPPVAPSASARKIEFPVRQRAENMETEAKDWLYYQLFSKYCPVKNCQQFDLGPIENISKRKGCEGCSWKEDFYTSSKCTGDWFMP